MKRFLRSLRFGLAGLLQTTKTEPNMRWHLVAAVVATGLGVYFQITSTEWCLIIGCIGIMLALECINTAIERLADKVCSEENELIRQTKDAAAGAVLVMSIATAVIGLMIFGPKLL